MKKKFNHISLFVFLSIAVLMLDLITKVIAEQQLLHPYWLIDGQVGFYYAENYGIAFSIPFSGPLLIVTNLIIIASLLYYIFKYLDLRNDSVMIASSLLIGGAAGNMLDRLTRGYVVDFIAIGRFPVFNIADVALTVSAFLLIWHLLRQK